MTKELDITPSPRLLQMLGEIPLDEWQCLAELVDNSIDELLKLPDRSKENPLTVDIEVEDNGFLDTTLIVRDNGLGMTEKELGRSLKAGHSGRSRYGSLGLFGMGFNIATARLGNSTEVLTSVPGSRERLKATIDFRELQTRETFQVPLETSRCEEGESGTEVRIKLKRSLAENFKNSRKVKAIGRKLGDVYSYLLRDSVPGLSAPGMSQDIPVILTLGGEPVPPRLPCVWSDQRSVSYKGSEVQAIQYIDTPYPEATACMDCGHWDTGNGPTECDECGSANIEKRDRRVWGWIGIQRYLDTNDFGIDFLRYGRKILLRDKDIFVFENPDTLEKDMEYPIEMPANRGRIIGEIHLDHVPVVYQKNRFDTSTQAWSQARARIRDHGPLKPREARNWRAGYVNHTELAKLYGAFRRNDPGLRSLHPGDGKGAIHEQSKVWSKSFYKGVPRYQEDTIWYEAAEQHQRKKDGVGEDSETPAAGDGGSTIADIIFKPTDGDPKNPTPDPDPAPTQPQTDQLDEARALGNEITYLSRSYQLDRGLGRWNLSVWSTRKELVSQDGKIVPSRPGTISGKNLEIFVYEKHEIFLDYGRDIRDLSLMEAAFLIKGLTRTDVGAAEIYASLVRDTPDLKAGKNAVVERVDSFVSVLQRSLEPIVDRDPESFWSALDAQDKLEIEKAGVVRFPETKLEELSTSGRFIGACDAGPIAKLVSKKAAEVFDGAVFKGSWAGRNEELQGWIVNKVVMALEALAAFKAEQSLSEGYDIRITQTHLDYLESQLVEVD